MNAHIAKESSNGTITRMRQAGPSPKATSRTMIVIET